MKPVRSYVAHCQVTATAITSPAFTLLVNDTVMGLALLAADLDCTKAAAACAACQGANTPAAKAKPSTTKPSRPYGWLNLCLSCLTEFPKGRWLGNEGDPRFYTLIISICRLLSIHSPRYEPVDQRAWGV